jgi:hypothetical protein
MRVDGIVMLNWLAARIGHVTTDANEPLVFGQNVHQCVFAGGRFARRLLWRNRSAARISPDVITVVFRGTMTAKCGSHLDIRRPSALNNAGETMVAHGRGVSLIVGWAEPVENADTRTLGRKLSFIVASGSFSCGQLDKYVAHR